jgi:hypothetical protein
MPKHPTVKKGIPVNPEDCYSNRHLSGPEYKVYDVMMAFAVRGRVSREGKDGTGPLLFSASFKPTLVNALAQSVNQTMRMKDRLVEMGWLVLVKKGARRATGQQAPDTYRIFTHEEYVAANHGSCPPYEYAPDYDTAQAYGVRHGQRLRDPEPQHKNFWPKEPALRSAIEKFTAEEVSPVSDDEMAAWDSHVDGIKGPEPQNRVRTPNTGDGPEPQNGEGRTLNMVKPVPTKWEAPSPQNGEGRTPNHGENLIPPSGSPNRNTKPTTTTTTTTASPPAWLSGLWSTIDRSERTRDHDRYGGLKLRKAKLADIAESDSVRVSADVTGVLDWISRENENWVRIAWVLFAINPMPHCQPPNLPDGDPNPRATLFPVSVFLEHADSYINEAKAAHKVYLADKSRVPMWVHYILEWKKSNPD